MKVRWFFAFFLISGFCSLVYEVVWLRLTMASFGVTTAMVSIVLSVFMTGLGIGSWGGGRLIRRYEGSGVATPLRLYGLTELLIGVSGLLVPHLINAGHNLLSHAGKDLAWGSSLYYLGSGSWVAIALIPWCTCMGATFPFGMAAIRRNHPAESQRSFSYLYLANVLGAILGTLVPAFALIEMLGFRGTLRLTSAVNVGLATVVFLLSAKEPPPVTAPRPAADIKLPSSLFGMPGTSALWLLLTTGVCSMAMEVIWIRQFTVYLGNVVYAFAAILALYLGATFAGSRAYRQWIRSHDIKSCGVAWILSGALGLLPLLFADVRFPMPEFADPMAAHAMGVVRACLGVVPFSALVGFLTPMLVDYWSGGDPDRAGHAYAVNVAGSVLGPLLAGFWILPWFGECWGLCVTSLPLLAIGFLAAVRGREGYAIPWLGLKPKSLYLGVVVWSIFLAVITEGYDAWFPSRLELRDHTATVIATGEGMEKRLLVNGMGMTNLTIITKVMAHFPLALLGSLPKSGLVICFGMGTTFRSMMTWGIDTTAVELVPSVPKVFGYFHPDGPGLLKSPLAHMVIDDGRRFLDRSHDAYDVVTVDPPPPVGAPASSLLYSREFYTLIKRHLRRGGILQVWLPSREPATRAAATKALQESFAHVRAFESIEGWGTHFLASMDAFSSRSAEELSKRLPAAAAADLVEWERPSTPEGIMKDMLGREEQVAGLIAADSSVPPIGDDRPINEYFLLRLLFGYGR